MALFTKELTNGGLRSLRHSAILCIKSDLSLKFCRRSLLKQVEGVHTSLAYHGLVAHDLSAVEEPHANLIRIFEDDNVRALLVPSQ